MTLLKLDFQQWAAAVAALSGQYLVAGGSELHVAKAAWPELLARATLSPPDADAGN